ncbi:hypothetical protein Cma02nite_25900 [Cellulomonas marina]|uniref:Uncharacterized protein n=1 Tax=Cellulomonas marina TaxID=988821 RepID=A0A1I0W477_9CELL|nr:hypothetical protein Cma02nite_25900 [Cellulomonas marina]SFA83549.1 hypothetical protein SAMN05421867_102173 [Cellulomonas marina]
MADGEGMSTTATPALGRTLARALEQTRTRGDADEELPPFWD